jgi:hypothetical protein
LWIAATSLSYAGGGKISAFVSNNMTGDFVVFLGFALMSLAIAVAQWLVIRRYIRGVGWLWTTVVGGAVGGSLSSWASFQLAVTYGEAVDLLVIYACLRGLTTGFMQWTIIKHHFKRSGWWVVGTTASWYAGVMVGSLLMNKLDAFYWLFSGVVRNNEMI